MIQSMIKTAGLAALLVASAAMPLAQAQPLPLDKVGALHNEDVEWRNFPAFREK